MVITRSPTAYDLLLHVKPALEGHHRAPAGEGGLDLIHRHKHCEIIPIGMDGAPRTIASRTKSPAISRNHSLSLIESPPGLRYRYDR